MVYSSHAGRSIVQQKPVPSQPRTPAQQAVRATFTAIGQNLWRLTLTPADKQAWNAYAKVKRPGLLGINLFLQSVIDFQKKYGPWPQLYNVRAVAIGSGYLDVHFTYYQGAVQPRTTIHAPHTPIHGQAAFTDLGTGEWRVLYSELRPNKPYSYGFGYDLYPYKPLTGLYLTHTTLPV